MAKFVALPAERKEAVKKLHSTPKHNLLIEPWIPVVDVTTEKPRKVGLQELFQTAYKVRLGSQNALEKYSILRQLISYTYLLVAYDPGYNWKSVVQGPAPFSSLAVEKLLERIERHSFLLHSETPFLQSIQLLDLASGNPGDPLSSIQPHVPANTNEDMWNRASFSNDPTFNDIALSLLVRYWCATPGLESNVKQGEKLGNSGKGGQLFHGPRSRAHFFQTRNTLAQTLVSNLVEDIQAQTQPDSLLFWEKPGQLDNTSLFHPLYMYSSTSNLSLLSQTDPVQIIRTPFPHTKEEIDLFSVSVREFDPHVVRIQNQKSNGEVEVKEARVSSEANTFENAYNFYRVVGSLDHASTNVLQRSKLFLKDSEEVEVLCVESEGTAMGVRIGDAVFASLRSEVFTLQAHKAEVFKEILDQFAGNKSSIRTLTTYWTRSVVTDNSSAAISEGISDKTKLLLWQQASDSFEKILQEIEAGPTSTQALDTDGVFTYLTEDVKKEWINAAITAFTETLNPYLGNPRMRTVYAKNKTILRRKLWNTLLDTQ